MALEAVSATKISNEELTSQVIKPMMWNWEAKETSDERPIKKSAKKVEVDFLDGICQDLK